MSKDVKVTKIEAVIVKIKGQSHELTVEEAKALRDELNELFGKNEIVFPSPTNPLPVQPVRPYIPWYPTDDDNTGGNTPGFPGTPWRPNIVWCGPGSYASAVLEVQ